MTEEPARVSAHLRKTLEAGPPASRRRSTDGWVALLVPSADDAPWTRARRVVENARRAMGALPAITTTAPHELRRRWAEASTDGPKEILDRMSEAIEWYDRYCIRRMLLALTPEEGDETVVNGPAKLVVHEGRQDGRVTATIESPAWAAHDLSTPEGRMAVSDALTVAGQTGTSLDRSAIQRAINQLVWSGNTAEIDRCAACLACDPKLVDGGDEDRVDFGRMAGREAVKLYLG